MINLMVLKSKESLLVIICVATILLGASAWSLFRGFSHNEPIFRIGTTHVWLEDETTVAVCSNGTAFVEYRDSPNQKTYAIYLGQMSERDIAELNSKLGLPFRFRQLTHPKVDDKVVSDLTEYVFASYKENQLTTRSITIEQYEDFSKYLTSLIDRSIAPPYNLFGRWDGKDVPSVDCKAH